jgi:hypothetical protein
LQGSCLDESCPHLDATLKCTEQPATDLLHFAAAI